VNATSFYDVARLALDCVCDKMDSLTEELAEEGITYGCPCRAYVSPSAPVFDDCCDWRCTEGESHGQLSVYINDTYPSDNFPSPSGFIFPCKPAVHVVSLVITVARCAPTMDEQGVPPPVEEIEAAAQIGAIDMWAVTTALQCCVPDNPPPGKTKRRVQITSAGTASVPEQGGCAAIEIRAFVEAGVVCGCPSESS
jgi:hypothetical protein